MDRRFSVKSARPRGQATLVSPRNHERHIAFVGDPPGAEIIQVALVRAHAPAALVQLGESRSLGPARRYTALPRLNCPLRISRRRPQIGPQITKGDFDLLERFSSNLVILIKARQKNPFVRFESVGIQGFCYRVYQP